jgi:hypothetical protein
MASASLARTMASAFLRLSQNHWKIIGKTKKSGFCMTYSVTISRVHVM